MKTAALIAVCLAAASATPAVAEPKTWAFEPGEDTLSPNALLDLRYLNEDVAGETGFVRASNDGNSFVRGDGEPIRFWAVNTYAQDTLDEDELFRHFEFLAKRGVNMVRWHGQLPQQAEGAALSDIDEQALDDLHKMVAAAKRAGIYLTISPYYPHALGSRSQEKTEWSKGVPASWGVPVDSEGMTGLIYFHPKVQAAYKVWLRELMTRENPYTGTALKDEPAVAIVQMQNEDSLLFWTLSQIKGEEARLLSKAFGDFAKKKHGSFEQAYKAWDGVRPRDAIGGIEDDRNAGVLGVTGIWHMTQKQDPASGFGRRLADQTEFLATTMFDWHAEVARYLEEDLGSPHLFNAGNWRTADDLLLDDLERYSYTAGDVIGINRYVTTKHEGKHTGWAIVNGDVYTNESVLHHPERLSVALKQPAGHPYIVTETLWVPPNLYQSEAPLLTSIYQSIGGVDIAYWFAISDADPQWRQPSSANGYLPSLGKWQVGNPMTLGMFPAAALVYRKGYIEEGKPVVEEYRPPADLWNRRVPAIASEAAFDPNRDSAPKGQSPTTAIDRQSFFRGPVVSHFTEGNTVGGDRASSMPVRPDEANVSLHFNRVVVDEPHVYAEIGFEPAGGPDYTAFGRAERNIDVRDAYAAAVMVSLDGKPLDTSERVLVQVGTSARPTGWQVSPPEADSTGDSEHTIVSYGKAPWQVRESSIRVRLTNPNLTTIATLDPNGMPAGKVEFQREGNTLQFTVPPNYLYVILYDGEASK